MNKVSLFATAFGLALVVSAPFAAVATLAAEVEAPLTVAALEKPVSTEKATETSELAASVDSNVKEETESFTAKLDSELSVKIAKELIAKLKF